MQHDNKAHRLRNLIGNLLTAPARYVANLGKVDFIESLGILSPHWSPPYNKH